MSEKWRVKGYARPRWTLTGFGPRRWVYAIFPPGVEPDENGYRAFGVYRTWDGAMADARVQVALQALDEVS